MFVIRSINNSETKEFMRKLKKMHKFTKELIDCIETEYEDDEFDDDDDEDYRENETMSERRGMIRRYRRGM